MRCRSSPGRTRATLRSPTSCKNRECARAQSRNQREARARILWSSALGGAVSTGVDTGRTTPAHTRAWPRHARGTPASGWIANARARRLQGRRQRASAGRREQRGIPRRHARRPPLGLAACAGRARRRAARRARGAAHARVERRVHGHARARRGRLAGELQRAAQHGRASARVARAPGDGGIRVPAAPCGASTPQSKSSPPRKLARSCVARRPRRRRRPRAARVSRAEHGVELRDRRPDRVRARPRGGAAPCCHREPRREEERSGARRRRRRRRRRPRPRGTRTRATRSRAHGRGRQASTVRRTAGGA